MLSLENSDDLFLVIAHFYDFLAFHISQIIHLACSLTPHFREKNFLATFFTILSRNLTVYLSKILMTFFSHQPFFSIFCPSVFYYFTDDDFYFFLFAHYTPLLYTHMLFFTFLHLALCSR